MTVLTSKFNILNIIADVNIMRKSKCIKKLIIIN